MVTGRRPLPPRPTTGANPTDDVDAGDVLGFERESEAQDPKKRAARRFREETAPHFKPSGDHFKSLFNFEATAEENKRAAIALEEKKKAAREQFEKDQKEKEEKLRKLAVEKAMEEEKAPKLMNPFSLGKKLGAQDVDQQAERRASAGASTDQASNEPRAADIALARRRDQSEPDTASPQMSTAETAAGDAESKSEDRSKSSSRKEEQEEEGRQGPVIVANPSQTGQPEDSKRSEDEPQGSRGPEATPEQERDVILARQAYARRLTELNKPVQTTNLSAATGSVPAAQEEPTSPTGNDGAANFEGDASLNRSFVSPRTSITQERPAEKAVERASDAEQSVSRQKLEIYERGAMVICSEPVRPGSDVAIVISPTAQNAESRYLLVCPIEKRNSPLNQPFAVDIPQHRGCFTVRCDWTRSIEVGMVSRVEQRQVPPERLAAVEDALRTATGLQMPTPSELSSDE